VEFHEKITQNVRLVVFAQVFVIWKVPTETVGIPEIIHDGKTVCVFAIDGI